MFPSPLLSVPVFPAPRVAVPPPARPPPPMGAALRGRSPRGAVWGEFGTSAGAAVLSAGAAPVKRGAVRFHGSLPSAGGFSWRSTPNPRIPNARTQEGAGEPGWGHRAMPTSSATLPPAPASPQPRAGRGWGGSTAGNQPPPPLRSGAGGGGPPVPPPGPLPRSAPPGGVRGGGAEADALPAAVVRSGEGPAPGGGGDAGGGGGGRAGAAALSPAGSGDGVQRLAAALAGAVGQVDVVGGARRGRPRRGGWRGRGRRGGGDQIAGLQASTPRPGDGRPRVCACACGAGGSRSLAPLRCPRSARCFASSRSAAGPAASGARSGRGGWGAWLSGSCSRMVSTVLLAEVLVCASRCWCVHQAFPNTLHSSPQAIGKMPLSCCILRGQWWLLGVTR